MIEGIAELPLHEGAVPEWILRRMRRLAKAIVAVLIDEYGADELVRRLMNPIWFQCFNNVIGMDWDSSGSTTVTMGILKEISWSRDYGFLILGGKGGRARRVPEEVPQATRRLGLGDEAAGFLEKASRIAAKVDTCLLQAGYTLYHHNLIVTESGLWGVIQQGMNLDLMVARRYHWLSPRNLTLEPHKDVLGVKHREALNLVDRESVEARKTILDLAVEKPSYIKKLVAEARRVERGVKSITEYCGFKPELSVKSIPVIYRPVPPPEHIERVMEKLRSNPPESIDELILRRSVGPSVVRALALIADLIYNARPSRRDPVTSPLNPLIYAYAVGGKDGVPYPFNAGVADEAIRVLEEAIDKSRVDWFEKRLALKRLARAARRVLGGASP